MLPWRLARRAFPFALGVSSASLAATGCGARTSLDAAESRGAGGGGGGSGGSGSCGVAKKTHLARVTSRTGVPHIEVWIASMTVAKGELFIGVEIEDGNANGHGFIVKVPTAGGDLVPVTNGAEQYSYGEVVHDDGDLYYPRPFFQNSTLHLASVTARAIGGGAEVKLDNPVPSATFVIGLAASSQGGAVWCETDDDFPFHTWVLGGNRHGSELIAEVDDFIGQSMLLGSTLYGASTKQLFAIPIEGGLDVVRPLTNNAKLLAANATTLFFTPDGSTILARDAAGEHAIATADPASLRDAGYADELAFYYDDAKGLVRVPLDGGAPKTISSATTVQAITGDGCNVYWAVPAEVDYGNVDVFALANDAP